MSLLLQLNEEGRTIIIVTHDMEVANKCNRIIELVDGKLYGFSNSTKVHQNNCFLFVELK